ncbi:MAG: exodeoxyribonuclease VII large subunit [Bacillota bacterium]|nr:exodeoxyribonuclease VII large subunit [Bacillota bacterium]
MARTVTPVVYSVQQLTQRIRELLEDAPGLTAILVRGELSNFRQQHPSGHLYFTLKDDQAQLRCVMWRSRAQNLRFMPRDGQKLVAFGSIRVYEARGEYQLQVEELWPDGEGELFLAFTELKARLEAEGLFAPERKRPLPLFPRCVGVVTSPVGAAIRDIIHVIRRRAPGIDILLAPAVVQGEEAPESLVAALKVLGQHPRVEVIIVGRGGGSLEELSAFNDERVARAIAACPVPVVSAVGHETDFTIADFVADCRAATPSAGAELVAPDALRLRNEVERLAATLGYQLRSAVEGRRMLVERLTGSRAFDLERRLGELAQGLDELNALLGERLVRRSQLAQRALNSDLWPRLVQAGLNLTRRSATEVARWEAELKARGHGLVERRRGEWAPLVAALDALSPLKTLGRGYAVCRRPGGQVLREAGTVAVGEEVEVVLARGQLGCAVTGVFPDGGTGRLPFAAKEEQKDGGEEERRAGAQF